jgi:DNA-binding GntR family transcriptional regulator
LIVEPIVRPESLGSIAYRQLRGAILDGGLRRGEGISVVSLAAQLGMSRSPVRAAIERLTNEGLLEVTPSGAVIAEMESRDLLDAVQVRAVLEGLASRLAAVRLTSNDLERLAATQAEFEQAVNTDDRRAAKLVDMRFHQMIHDYCGNASLIEHLERVCARVVIGTYVTALSSDMRLAVPEHGAMISALRDRDPIAAEAAAVVHLNNVGERIRAAWARREQAAVT